MSSDQSRGGEHCLCYLGTRADIRLLGVKAITTVPAYPAIPTTGLSCHECPVGRTCTDLPIFSPPNVAEEPRITKGGVSRAGHADKYADPNHGAMVCPPAQCLCIY